MKIKDMIMLWIIIGIAFFFVGGMINSAFQEDDDSDIAYKISSTFKLLGLGILITTLIIGGIIQSNLNKSFKLVLLIVGLILLLIFTIAAQFMKWDETSNDEIYFDKIGGSSSQGIDYEEKPSTPGFELIAGILAISSIAIYKKYKNKG